VVVEIKEFGSTEEIEKALEKEVSETKRLWANIYAD
jgi:hypothetical protein